MHFQRCAHVHIEDTSFGSIGSHFAGEAGAAGIIPCASMSTIHFALSHFEEHVLSVKEIEEKPTDRDISKLHHDYL